jgi:mono/diheme cytochrome c family protein
MFTRSVGFFAAMCVAGGVAAAEIQQRGQPITDAEAAAWDISIAPDGAGLPSGRGTVKRGEQVFAEKCVACHGEKGQGKPADRLVGGQGTLGGDQTPVKTVGSYWPYATTLFDYIRRAMPITAPQSLSAEEVYSVSAYLLYLNGIIAEKTVLDAKSLPRVKMPNRDNFHIVYPAKIP